MRHPSEMKGFNPVKNDSMFREGHLERLFRSKTGLAAIELVRLAEECAARCRHTPKGYRYTGLAQNDDRRRYDKEQRQRAQLHNVKKKRR